MILLVCPRFLLVFLLLVAGCATKPKALDQPEIVSGTVRLSSSGRPVKDAKVEIYWTQPGVLMPRRELLAKAKTDVNGRYETTITNGPAGQLWASTEDHLYSGLTYLNRKRSTKGILVNLAPSISMGFAWLAEHDSRLQRFREIVVHMVSSHVPGCPTNTESLQSHLDAGRITKKDVAFLLENRDRFSGPIPSLNQNVPYIRIYWGGLEMEYYSVDAVVKFLTWEEANARRVPK